MLATARRHPGFLAMLCTAETVYLSRRFSIWQMNFQGAFKGPRISAPVPQVLKLAAHSRHLRRLGRLDIREMLLTPAGSLLGVAQKGIFRWRQGEITAKPVLQVSGGGRPKGLVATPPGRILVGEYWGNPQLRSLRIWASADDGDTWELAHTLPAGSAKHIHNLVWDPYRRGIWTLTGDADDQCALIFTGDEFVTVTEVVRGGQMFRACQLFCRPEGLYYGTDTERDENWVVFLEPESRRLEKIQPLPGSCIYAARMAGRYWISTSVEPSKVNRYPYAALWCSLDLHHWTKVKEFAKDWWPGEYFGFGNIILPRVQGDCPVLVFSPVAVKNHDLETFYYGSNCLGALSLE